jgi:hypothetical protein
MITCQGVLVITVTEFVGKLLYVLLKHSSKISLPYILYYVSKTNIVHFSSQSQVLTSLSQIFILAIHNYLIIMQNCKHKASANKFIPDYSNVPITQNMSWSSDDNFCYCQCVSCGKLRHV